MTSLDNYSLDDRYTNDEGRVFLTGIQALARLPMEQLRVDAAAGARTAAFLSGYQGSPLGGFDQEMARAVKRVPELTIVSQPAVNEELAATAVMGSQVAPTLDGSRFDGVLGIWYGKAPGVDRASDALRHAVYAGAHPSGGALALAGDDPACKSSTLPSSSDVSLINLKMPIIYPGDVQEILDLGRHAVALSRFCGQWTGFKIVTAVADGTGTVDLSLGRVVPRWPESAGEPRLFRPTANLIAPFTNEMERDIVEVRLELARRYSALNNMNRVVTEPARPWLGIVASGYTYRELRQALRRLGLETGDQLADAGIRVMKLDMPFPLAAEPVVRFARGLERLLVVEEKGPALEWLIKDVLYNTTDRPLVVNEDDETGKPLFPRHGFLAADQMVDGLRKALSHRLADRLAPEPPKPRERVLIPLTTQRSPYFCSGCPHNWGTKVPDGTLVGAGIGCSGMALLMDDSKVGDITGITCMGAEGTQWIGMEPFLDRDHYIQNLGDGTFFHSGQLAVQAAVAAGAHMTYKLLYNGTVAMTGGQDAAGQVGVPGILQIALAHGVTEAIVTTDDVARYDDVDLPAADDGTPTRVWDRTRIVEAQRYLATRPGVTLLVHDQACAAQTRRLRKRGVVETPGFRVAINHRICEACGDCGEVSNCLSVHSIDTELGPKTLIDQTSCNLDYSCLHGDCPSFMTVAVDDQGTAGKRKLSLPRRRGGDRGQWDVPSPVVDKPYDFSVRFAGIGGTGVVTVAQILGTAAMFDGWNVRGLDQTGLSQKAGPVVSDLRLTRSGAAESNLLGQGEADLIVGFDLLVAASSRTLTAADESRTALVASASKTPTGEMIGRNDVAYPELGELGRRVAAVTRSDVNRYVDAGAITRGLLGDAATANVFLLGVAVQAGLLPIDPEAVERAVDLNGVAVEANIAAFSWGRRWVVDADRVETQAGISSPGTSNSGGLGRVVVPELPLTIQRSIGALDLDLDLADRIGFLAADLVGYQDASYADSFVTFVASIASAEQASTGRVGDFTRIVADGLHKLMAYKDEYEVARLLIAPEAEAMATTIGGPGAKVSWKLHPPLLRALGMGSKMTIDQRVGRPVMKILARGKRLRGTAADPFGRTALRRLERNLITEYREVMAQLARRLDAGSYPGAVDVARAALDVRGYEEIKMERAAVFRAVLRAAAE